MGSVSAQMSSQRALLLSRVTGQREHVLAQLEGLTDEQLRRPVLPSGWSSLGLVRHLTLSDERYWFEVVVAGEPLAFWPEGDNGDWLVEQMSRLRKYSLPTALPSLALTRSSPPALWMTHRGSRRSGGPTQGWPFQTCTASSCTSSSTPRFTPATWTRSVN